MYADTGGYFGQASGMPYSRLHELRGRDITNFQDKIERLRREGIRLSPKLEWDAFVTAYTVHDEVPLHSYPRRIMPSMRQLREQEERARANISEFDPSTFDKNGRGRRAPVPLHHECFSDWRFVPRLHSGSAHGP